MMPTVLADGFWIARNSAPCHACGKETPVTAIVVHDFADRIGPEDEWRMVPDAGMLSCIREMNSLALSAWTSAAPWVQVMPSKTAGMSYLSNTCVHCGRLQGDWYLREPEGPFFPITTEQESRLTLKSVNLPLEAVADVGEASWIDRMVERIKRSGR